MANPFEVLSQIQAFKEQSEELLRTTDPRWFMRAAAGRALEMGLQLVLDAGPPTGFAASLGIDEAQARVLYTRVLTAAIARQRELVALNAG
jgi:hypothetical protein